MKPQTPVIVLIQAANNVEFDLIGVYLSSIASPLRYSDNFTNKIESYLTDKQRSFLMEKMPALKIQTV